MRAASASACARIRATAASESALCLAARLASALGACPRESGLGSPFQRLGLCAICCASASPCVADPRRCPREQNCWAWARRRGGSPAPRVFCWLPMSVEPNRKRPACHASDLQRDRCGSTKHSPCPRGSILSWVSLRGSRDRRTLQAPQCQKRDMRGSAARYSSEPGRRCPGTEVELAGDLVVDAR